MRNFLAVLLIGMLATYGLIDSSYAYKLPDTGQDKCYADFDPVEISCGGATFGQDAVYAQGPAPAYSDNGDGTVTDLNTGLIWQQSDDGVERTWGWASNYCATLELADHADWRLPSRRELQLIVDYGRFDPAIDTNYFLDCQNGLYWTSTTVLAYPSNSWTVYFGQGAGPDLLSSMRNKSSTLYARCVRGPTPPLSVYVDNQDGTVLDQTLGIMWQKEIGTGLLFNGWANHLSYCESLQLAGYSDWRLPNSRELESLVNETTYNPAIHPIFGSLLGELTSSTSLAYYPHDVIVLGTEHGSIHHRQKQNSRSVRCVRLTPPSDYWERMPLQTNTGLNSVSFPDYNSGWIVGSNGTILATNDGGNTWSPQSIIRSTTPLESVHFVDKLNGWLLENVYGMYGRGHIHHTEDGGFTWYEQQAGNSVYLKDIYFIDESRGWVVGNQGVILYTDNGGEDWVPQNSNATAAIYSIDFINANIGWIVGGSGIILHTNNGGANWITQASGTDSDLKSVKFVDALNGCVVGSGGTILHTSDGGTNWISQTYHPDISFNAVDFLDDTAGWAVGSRLNNTVMIKTSDFGQSWESIYAGSAAPFRSITFAGGTDGWAIGYRGTIMRLQLCMGDLDADLDVDGSDLSEMIENPTAITMDLFLRSFGKTSCPPSGQKLVAYHLQSIKGRNKEY